MSDERTVDTNVAEAEHDPRWTAYDRSIFDLLDAAADQRPDGRLIPRGEHGLGVIGLCGPTQCGKSTLIRHWAEERHGWPLVTSFIGCDDSTDISGFPVRSKNSDGHATLEFTNPSIIPVEYLKPEMAGKWVLFLDELEKADQATLSPILSLLAERRLRHLTVRPAAVVVAMNPPQRPIHPAVLARILLVEFPGKDYPILERADLRPMARYFAGINFADTCDSWPERRTHYGSAHRITKWARTRKIFWANPTVMDLVLDGSLTEADADHMRALFRDVPQQPALEWARTSTPTEVAAGILYYLIASDAPVALRLQEILAQRAAEDLTGELSLVLDAFYGSRKPVSPLAALEPHDGEAKLVRDQRVKTGATFLLKKYETASRKAAKERLKNAQTSET